MKMRRYFFVVLFCLVSFWITDGFAEEVNFPWEGNKLGVDETVPSPWTPVVVKENKSEYIISVWGRKIRFRKDWPFPVQIQNQGKDMLTALQAGKSWIVEKTRKDLVVLRGKGIVGGLEVSTKIQIEFDGFIKFDLYLKPKIPLKIKRLFLNIPMREDVAKYYYHPYLYGTRAEALSHQGVINKTRSFPFYDLFFSLANEDIGLYWTAESSKGWYLQRKDRPLQIIKEEGTVIFRQNFVDGFGRLDLKEERHITFAIQPTPIKPMPKDWKRWTLPGIWKIADFKSYLKRTPGLKPIFLEWIHSFRGVKDKAPDVFLGHGIPIPAYPKRFKSFMEPYHKLGIPLVHYINPSMVDIYIYKDGKVDEPLPEWKKYRKEWLGGKEDFNVDGPWREADVCGFSKSYQDYLVYQIYRGIKEFNLDGLYIDGVYPRRCKNPDHPEGSFVDKDGNRYYIRPNFSFREMYKRIYKVVKKLKPKSLLIFHGGLPPLAFGDINVTGEEFIVLTRNTFYTDFLTPEQIKGQAFRGKQLGIPIFWLPAYRGEFAFGSKSVAATRAMLSLFLLIDTHFWDAYANKAILHNIEAIRARQKLWKAKFVPFWRNTAITTDVKEVKISYWKGADKVVIAVCNPSQKNLTKVTINLHFNDLDLLPKPSKKNYLVKNLETGELLRMEKFWVLEKSMGTLSLRVPKTDFRLIYVGLSK